jgi:hypothetical protein
VPNRT